MKVLLKSDIKSVGSAGEIVNAKDGYARNFLLPRGLAVEATPAILAEVEAKNLSMAHHAAEQKAAAAENATHLDGITVEIRAKGGENKLFGSVTAGEVAEAVEKATGIAVDKKRITAPDMKTYGDYEAVIKLHPTVSAKLTVRVVRED